LKSIKKSDKKDENSQTEDIKTQENNCKTIVDKD
jgi:hypothetical protein